VLFNTDRASLNVEISDGVRPNAFFEQLLNGMINRISGDVYLGSGAPAAGLGSNGDTYIDVNALTFYTKASGSWSASTALDNNANTLKLSIPTNGT